MGLRSLVAVIAAVAGIGVGGLIYHLTADRPTDVSPAAVTRSALEHADTAVPVPHIVPATHFVLAPCRPPAVRKRDVCVTELVETLPGPPPADPATD